HGARRRTAVEVAAGQVGVEDELRVEVEEQHGEGAAEEERGVAHDAAAHVGQGQLRERHWSPPTAPPITLRLSRICWKNAWRLEPRRNWLKARPALMNTIRRQKLAENASCVTITTVTPSSWLRRCSA